MKISHLLTCLGVLSLAGTSHAAILFTSINGTQGTYNTNTTVVTGYTPTTATNSALLLAVALDGPLSSPSASFGGNAMTLLASNTRVAIFGTVLTSTTPGDITLKTGLNNAETILTYGTISGIDTSLFGSLQSTTGATGSGASTVTMSSALTGLGASDYVLTIIDNNSAWGLLAPPTLSSGLNSLNYFSGGGGASYTTTIAGGVVGAGDYTSSVTWNNDDAIGAGTGTTANLLYATQIAFTAIPEPSTYALFGGLAIGALLVLRRHRTRR